MIKRLVKIIKPNLMSDQEWMYLDIFLPMFLPSLDTKNQFQPVTLSPLTPKNKQSGAILSDNNLIGNNEDSTVESLVDSTDPYGILSNIPTITTPLPTASIETTTITLPPTTTTTSSSFSTYENIKIPSEFNLPSIDYIAPRGIIDTKSRGNYKKNHLNLKIKLSIY